MGLGILLRSKDGGKSSILCLLSFVWNEYSWMGSRASSKHLRSRRFPDAIQSYLYAIRWILVALYLEVNARPAPFVDHAGIRRRGGLGSDDFYMREY